MQLSGVRMADAAELLTAMYDQIEASEVARTKRGKEDAQAGANCWPLRPSSFGELLTPVEATQYLRLDETGAHTPESAIRTLNYWRDKGELKATKFARRVWYRKIELDRFLEKKTET